MLHFVELCDTLCFVSWKWNKQLEKWKLSTFLWLILLKTLELSTAYHFL